MSDLDNATKKAILAEVLAMTLDDPVEDDEFTVKEFAVEAGIERRSAAERLGKLVDSGMLTRRQVLRDGAHCHVYKKVE